MEIAARKGTEGVGLEDRLAVEVDGAQVSVLPLPDGLEALGDELDPRADDVARPAAEEPVDDERLAAAREEAAPAGQLQAGREELGAGAKRGADEDEPDEPEDAEEDEENWVDRAAPGRSDEEEDEREKPVPDGGEDDSPDELPAAFVAQDGRSGRDRRAGEAPVAQRGDERPEADPEEDEREGDEGPLGGRNRPVGVGEDAARGIGRIDPDRCARAGGMLLHGAPSGARIARGKPRHVVAVALEASAADLVGVGDIGAEGRPRAVLRMRRPAHDLAAQDRRLDRRPGAGLDRAHDERRGERGEGRADGSEEDADEERNPAGRWRPRRRAGGGFVPTATEASVGAGPLEDRSVHFSVEHALESTTPPPAHQPAIAMSGERSIKGVCPLKKFLQ